MNSGTSQFSQVGLSVYFNIRLYIYICIYIFLRYRSEILYTFFSLQEAAHIRSPPYKLNDRNQVLAWKTFSFDANSEMFRNLIIYVIIYLAYKTN